MTQLELTLPASGKAIRIVDPTREEYRDECRKWWGGECLRDAWRNRGIWVAHSETIRQALGMWMADDLVTDLSGNFLNPEGTLDSWLWRCSASNAWMVDFEQHFQRLFLRRGLRQWCRLAMKGGRR